MTPAKQTSPALLPNEQFRQVEEMIDQSIAGLDAEERIEYGTTIERKPLPSRWKRWIYRILRR